MYSEAPSSSGSLSSVGSSSGLKLYQAFIFSVPIFFIFVLLLLFYLFYLRRRRVDWSSLRMRTPLPNNSNNHISLAELGLNKHHREMLPIIIYKETFSIRDNLCSVCLGEYQTEDKLQQIPACGHTFHMACIDHWLAIHTTCPLCRLSLLASAKPSTETPQPRHADDESETGHRPSVGTSIQPQAVQEPSSGNDEAGVPVQQNGRNDAEKQDQSCGFSGNA